MKKNDSGITDERLFEMKEALSYDPDTGVFRWKCGQRAGHQAGNINTHGYRKIMVRGRSFSAGRLAWWFMFGREPNVIDHINGKRDDNRWENLREVTPTENNRNRSLARTNKSGYKGVFWMKDRQKWRAFIKPRDKIINLGEFDKKGEAVAARREGEEKYFGEYRRDEEYVHRDHCLVCDAGLMPNDRFCRDHWFALPLELRQRYWRETDYSRIAPNAQLIAEIRAER